LFGRPEGGRWSDLKSERRRPRGRRFELVVALGRSACRSTLSV